SSVLREGAREVRGRPLTSSSSEPGGLSSWATAAGALPDEALIAALASASTRFTGARPAPSNAFDRGGTGPAPLRGAASGLAVVPGGSVAPVRQSEPARRAGLAPSEAHPTASSAPASSTPADPSRVRESGGRLPLSFEPNRGQADAAVQFLAR